MSTATARLATLLAIAVAALLAVLAGLRTPLTTVWADEGTFLAMTASLAGDADLRFDERDLARLDGSDEGRGFVILQRSGGGVAYSKPVLYPLAAAPLYPLLGEWSLVAVNVLALAAALCLAGAELRRRVGADHAALLVVTFVGAAVVLPYVFWRMADIMQLALALAGLVLCLGQARPARAADSPSGPEHPGPAQRLLAWRGAPWLGAALLGLTISMRPSNAAIAAVPVLAALLGRRPRRAAALAAIVLTTHLGAVGLTWATTGATDPYRAERSGFHAPTGYPAGADAETAMRRFTEERATRHAGLRPRVGWSRIGYSAFYFLVGRHTGLAFYFPAALILLLAAFRRPDSTAFAALIGFGGAIGFLLFWVPWNYFGGETFIANRYLLPAYPALLLAPRRLPGRRLIAFAWLVAAVAYGSALLSERRFGDLDPSSQSHSHAGIFRLLPYESTALHLEGRSDRYWAGQFQRFVDPFAEVETREFELLSGRPPAELLIADWRPPGALRFSVTCDAPEATLDISDYRSSWRFPVGARPDRRPVPVVLEPSPAWRRHLFWWDWNTRYRAHTLRLALHTADGRPARARLRYFGNVDRLAERFSYELLASRLPKQGIAGGSSTARLRLRNTSGHPWRRDDSLVVHAGYRLYDAAGDEVAIGPRLGLPDTGVGQEAKLRLTVDWPEEPGDYRLEIDLVLEQVSWFAERLGAPVATTEITVRDADDEAAESRSSAAQREPTGLAGEAGARG